MELRPVQRVLTNLQLLHCPFFRHKLSDKGVKEILGKTLREEGDEVLKSFEQPGAFGGPHTGFLNDGPALLDSIMERRKLKKPFCTMESIVDSQSAQPNSSITRLFRW